MDQEALRIMDGFAARTGLAGEGDPKRRYLWTDAFALCNLLALERATGSAQHRQLADRLIGLVHHTLGRHRDDDARRGWLSGLDEAAGAAHPTAGGLRIGKRLPERGADERYDELLEWERDGQYFHYLTKWMHALDQAARALGAPRYNLWARELAHAAYVAFSRAGRGRLVWKMSVDLSRPLVPSMGQHDPLDGLVTCGELHDTALRLGIAGEGPDLAAELTGLGALASALDLATGDPLGLGGLLFDAARAAQLAERQPAVTGALVVPLLTLAHDGVAWYARSGELRRPPAQRLAFRELGLALGLRALPLITLDEPGVRTALAALGRVREVGTEIESFWLEPSHRRVQSWLDHQDINDVMLASCLVPEGMLALS
jgi:hypothetical protein